MNWKEFLRPTLAKLLLALAILIIFVPFLKYPLMCFVAPCGHGLLTFFRYLINSHTDSRANIYIQGTDYYVLIIGMIISYLLSGLIVLAMNKIRNRSKSQP